MFGSGKRRSDDDAGWTSGDGWDSGQEDVHTPASPYCGDLSCWCHTDVVYHEHVTSVGEPTEQEVQQAFSFFGLLRRSG